MPRDLGHFHQGLIRQTRHLIQTTDVWHESGGFRVYPPQTLDRLRFIKQAQTLGLSLCEIRELVAYQNQGGLKGCRQVRDLLRSKLTELQTTLAELEEFRNTLSRYLQDCERTLGGERPPQGPAEPECPVIETLRTKNR